jgi:hypothetical protein
VPALQVPLVAAEQQPPLQAWVELQAVVHLLVVASQAYPVGQSVAELHPHFPVVRQTWPSVLAVQSTQVPLAPQAASAVPARQLPPTVAEQQPVWQGVLESQASVHRLVVVSQATAVPGQSAFVAHPHCRAPPVVTQVSPAAPAVYCAGQSRQAPPLLPHAASAVPATQDPLWQHPPLQVWVALQVVVQVWVDVSQA